MLTRALVEGLLGGLSYPATPRQLTLAVRDAGVDDEVLAALGRLRRSAYGSANEVGEELFPVIPVQTPAPPVATAESGAPPGRSSYTEDGTQ